MDANTFNLYSLIFMIVNLIVTVVGLFLVILSIRAAGISIRKSIEHYSYDVWRTIYDKLSEHPDGIKFFNFEVEDSVDLKMMSIFLTILDMYANKFADDYSKLSSTPSILQIIMSSETSQKYWSICKNHFFSHKQFIQEIDKIVNDSVNKKTKA